MANRVRNNKTPKTKPRSQQNNSNKIKKRPRNRTQQNKRVADARQKILQKKRKGVTDARDILATMAKKQDARSKILKIREHKKIGKVINGSVRAIGSNILQKTDRNGKISLVTSKNKQNTTGIKLAIQQQLGLVSPTRKRNSLKSAPVTTTSTRKALSRNPPSSLIRKTVLSDMDYLPWVMPRMYESYSDKYLPVSRLNISSNPLMGRHNLLDTGDRQIFEAPVTRSRLTPSGYIDLDAPDDEEMPLAPPTKQTIFMQGTSRSSNVHSRLDTQPIHTQSHGIFAAPTKTKVVVPAGHRIVVSNLQQSVTQDDIRELFEDIGQLLVARLVRPGTAEVIYKNLKDAEKAVETYHNRQLDGQPMKCLLVNKRPLNNPTGPAISAKPDAGLLLGLNKKIGTIPKSSEKLIPDLQTIHKVLFQRN